MVGSDGPNIAGGLALLRGDWESAGNGWLGGPNNVYPERIQRRNEARSRRWLPCLPWAPFGGLALVKSPTSAHG